MDYYIYYIGEFDLTAWLDVLSIYLACSFHIFFVLFFVFSMLFHCDGVLPTCPKTVPANTMWCKCMYVHVCAGVCSRYITINTCNSQPLHSTIAVTGYYCYYIAHAPFRSWNQFQCYWATTYVCLYGDSKEKSINTHTHTRITQHE